MPKVNGIRASMLELLADKSLNFEEIQAFLPQFTLKQIKSSCGGMKLDRDLELENGNYTVQRYRPLAVECIFFDWAKDGHELHPLIFNKELI